MAPFCSTSLAATVAGAGIQACLRDGAPSSPQPIWQPAVNTTWQIVLSEPISLNPAKPSVTPDVDVFDVDLFETPVSTIKALHDLEKKVICYFSAGSYEPDRPDSDEFRDDDLGEELDGWPGEYWVDLRSDAVRSLMAKRIQLAARKGCDGVDPDNVDGYQNENGLGLRASDSINFVKFLSREAHKHSLAVGLKNAGDIIPDVLSVVEFSVNEECAAYDECGTFALFIRAGKPVFHIEYPKGAPDIKDSEAKRACGAKGAESLSTVLKKMDLDGWVRYCDGKEFETKTRGGK